MDGMGAQAARAGTAANDTVSGEGQGAHLSSHESCDTDRKCGLLCEEHSMVPLGTHLEESLLSSLRGLS